MRVGVVKRGDMGLGRSDPKKWHGDGRSEGKVRVRNRVAWG